MLMCQHTRAERESSAYSGGLCPLCLAADNKKLRDAMQRAADMLPANAACGVLRSALKSN